MGYLVDNLKVAVLSINFRRDNESSSGAVRCGAGRGVAWRSVVCGERT